MTAQILRAISSGYPAHVILDQIKRQFPQHANKINNALAMKYGADLVLKQLSEPNSNSTNTEKYLTDREKTKKIHAERDKKAILGLIGAAGTAGAIGAGLYGLATSGKAVQPSQILPAQGRLSPGQRGQPGQTINIQPRPGGGQGGLPYLTQGQTPQQPQQAPGQIAQATPSLRKQQAMQKIQQPQQAPAPITQNVQLVNNLQEDKRISNVIQNGFDIATTASILRKVLPRNKVDVLDKAEGGLEGVVRDYSQFMQDYPPAIQMPFIPQQAQGEQLPSIQEQNIPNEFMRQQQEDINQLEQPELGMLPQEEKQPISKRVQEAVFGGEEPKKISEIPELKRENFSIPNYHYPGESKEDFTLRKNLFDVINKAAKMVMAGKTFLDLPMPKDVQYSTAVDVLRFLAGVPNIYTPLLDEDEKDELTDAMFESGKMTVEGLRPATGEGNIYGAQLSPNLIWNLFLAIDPKIKKLTPPSVKGYKMATGGKMGTNEMRRFMNHSLYGVLSGKTVSNNLIDKISNISRASSSIDAIAKAAHAGNMRKMMDEMEKMMDDEYFMQIMDIEVHELLMSPEQKEKSELKKKEDIKNLASLKASQKRKEQKLKSTNED